MGSSSSSSSGILIQLERPSGYLNEEVTGMIHLSIKSAEPTAKLLLIFKGKEKTEWTETRTETSKDSEGKESDTTVTDYFKGKTSVIRISREVFTWEDGLKSGDYSIPFAFTLPDQIPGTFKYEKDSVKAEIIYTFQAILQNNSQNLIKGKTRVAIQHPASSFNSNLKLSKSANMKTWCCYKKGICRLDVSYPQDTYHPSQVASFFVEVDNSESLLQVSGVTCRLVMEMRIRDNYSGSKVLKNQIISDTVRVRIDPGEKLVFTDGVQINLNLPLQMQSFESMFSTKGKLIECVYMNEISANMNGMLMCCGDTPTVKSVMNIVPNLVYSVTEHQPPENWNPLIYDQVIIKPFPIPSAPELDT